MPTTSRHRLRTLLGIVLATALAAAACGSTTSPAPATPPANATAGPAGPSTSSGPDASVPAGETPAPSPSATPTPAPTPALVPGPLTGVLVTKSLAARHPIAVMIDDHWDARPQSGFTQASIVWQAPAEGGIPRYMMIFGEGNAASVGPVRSARLYFVQWASEWRAVFVHVGGSPQAMSTLAAKGQGQMVYNADEFRWGGTYLWRITQRAAPHNVYSDGAHLRRLAVKLGAADVSAKPAWTFADDAPLVQRPTGATIDISYPYNKIGYRYDPASNTWLRLTGGKAQVDAASKQRVAPKNVVIMVVRFGSLGAGQHGRLEASNIGSGTAWIATNGTVVKGTWKKAAATKPTLLYDAAGKPVVLTRGQTFVQVIPPGTPLKMTKGTLPQQGTPQPSASPMPSAVPTPMP